MKVQFTKYQATGNDFILIDNRSGMLSFSVEQIKSLCDRRFGIGADGLILIEKHPSLDFNMIYYNSDGSQSLCGNGSRAAVKFAASLGMVNGSATFQAYDGQHEAEILPSGIIRLRMNDVQEFDQKQDDYFLNTGSPHVIRFVTKVSEYPVFDQGKLIRFSEAYRKTGGTNANFVELLPDNTIFVRTYERGVENETLSCGTGVTASAIAASLQGYKSPVSVRALGGDLTVEFKKNQIESHFTDIYLIGPAKMVFRGELEL